MAFLNSPRRSRSLLAGIGVAVVLTAMVATAQDYRMHRGGGARLGRASAQSGIGVAETVWNNMGRGFLRWFDPSGSTEKIVDNGPSSDVTTTGTWSEAAPSGAGFLRLASLFYQASGVTQPYYWAKTVQATSKTDPTAGATAVYTWTVTGLDNSREYEADLSIPVGPTNTVPTAASSSSSLLYQQRYWVVKVQDSSGSTVSILDSTKGGGFVAARGPNDSKFYTPVSDGATGHITISLYNTAPLNSQGTLLDAQASPGKELVYADAVSVVLTTAQNGAYVASPVVGKLENASPVTLATDAFPQRVVHGRTDSVLVGALNTRYNIGLVTSSVANGVNADASEPTRRNRVWSWPVKAPLDNDATDRAAYLLRVGSWLTGPNTTDSRQYVRRVVDDLNSSTIRGGTGFASATTASGYVGGDYLAATVQSTVTSSVTFSAVKFPEASYFVDVYIPTGFNAGDLTQGATYAVKQGPTTVATFTLNQSTQRGWQRLGTVRYAHVASAPLTVTVSDAKAPADAGTELVVADAVRFVTDADWSVRSTPVMVSTSINDGTTTATRDVVVVASETGRLTCMDAHGDPTTGAAPDVYWTYPTEVSASDPNALVTEDGGGSETPVGFDLSSAMVQTVGGVDLLTIGSTNGRVYCFEMVGRGDGSVKRRWTYPDDFRPDAPAALQVPSNLGAIKGSVTAATVAGTPAVIVPTTSGKILALNAAGNSSKRTTSLLWEYPSGATTIGSVTQTPAYDAANNRLFFAAPSVGNASIGTVYCLNANTGAVVWSTTNSGAFGDFSTASLLYLPDATSTIGDTVYAVDKKGHIYALNAADGSIRWSAQEAGPGAEASISFAYMRTYDPAKVLQDAIPTVLVATTDGQLFGYYADGSTNGLGTHYDWNSYVLKGNNQKASFAVGGFPNTVVAQKCHLYVADSLGNLLAFSSVDDTNTVPPISTGRPPVTQQVSDNDPSGALMAVFKNKDFYGYYSPDDYATVSNKAFGGTLDVSDFTGLVDFNPSVSSPSALARGSFELGESVYFMLQVPGPNFQVGGVPIGAYSCELVSGSAESNSLRTKFGTGYDYDSGQKRAYFFEVPFMTGAGGFGPGDQTITFRFTRNVDGASVSWPVKLKVANPFAIQFSRPDASGSTVSSAGFTLDPAATTVLGNNPVGIDTNPSNFPSTTVVGGPTDRFLKPNFTDPNTQEAGGYLGPDPNSAGTPLTHGGLGQTVMTVYDRSLMTRLFGPNRGLSGVRAKTGDLTWQPLTPPSSWATDSSDASLPYSLDPSTDLGVVNPLNSGSNKSNWVYRKFEDYPWSRPNISRDYPDISRGNVGMTRSYLGTTQNPLAQGVDLAPPTVADADDTNYRGSGANGYGKGLNRTLRATSFNLAVAVPKYQPANQSDYRSRHTLYVDNGTGVTDTFSASRTFALGATVASDEKLVTRTPTLDLGSLAAGTGFNGYNGMAQAPFILRSEYTGQPGTSDLSPSNPAYNTGAGKLFGTLSVLNDGNVNVPNVRIAKAFSKGTVRRSVDLYSSSLQDLAWLDAQYNLFTDLDPRFSIPSIVAGAGAPVPAQKPRPDDPAPSRMSRNPVFRSNANLGVGTGSLVNPTSGLETGDIRVGVAVPVGTPVGTYQRSIYAFGDTGAPAGAEAVYPTLGPDQRNPSVYEPYVESGTKLKFSVSESRLTNSTRPRTAPNVDTLTTTADAYAWPNRQPTAYRSDDGRVYVAWASGRRDTTTGLPEFNPIARVRADYQRGELSRIYLARFNAGVPISGLLADDQDHSPLSDLNLARPAVTSTGPSVTDSRWFERLFQAGQPSFPDVAPTGLSAFFGLGASESIITGTGAEGTSFHSPVFPTSSLADPLESPASYRSGLTSPYVAFLGDATKSVAGGNAQPIHQVFLGQFNPTTGLVGNYRILAKDDSTRKSRPSLAQSGSEAVVAYTQSSVSGSDILATRINGTTVTTKRVGLRTPFEDIGAPNILWRRASLQVASSQNLLDVFFTGKVKGRATSEAFLTRVDPSLIAPSNSNESLSLVAFGKRDDVLTYDTATGTYWAPGLQWALDQASVSDIRLKYGAGTGGAKTDVIDPATLSGGAVASGKATVDRETGEIVADAKPFGGKVYLDTRSGAVRFSGASIPTNAQLVITYNPRVIRVGSSASSNYRGVSAAFDERFVGVHASSDPDQVLAGDLAWTYNDLNQPITSMNAAVRYDRLWVATDQTSRRGDQRTRPALSVWQYGITIPYAPNLVSGASDISLTGSAGGWFTLDPVGKTISFPADMEGVSVSYHYTATLPDGTTFRYPATGEATAVVSLINTRAESALPIDEPANESDVTLTLDPQNIDFNPIDPAKRRPPLVWVFWTSTRAGVSDVYFETVAPRITAKSG